MAPSPPGSTIGSQAERDVQVVARAKAAPGAVLGPAAVAEALFAALEQQVAGERVLVLVPDRTRHLPLAELFPLVAGALHRAAEVEVMVALGTHPPLPHEEIMALIGATGRGHPAAVMNHAWADPGALSPLGTIGDERIREIAGPAWHPSLAGDLVVRVNTRALRADRVVIVGPTLPHEVAGYSGGAKYLFPGISGPEMINAMHWLGALSGVLATIGHRDTPVRALIREAASLLPVPVSMVALVTAGPGDGPGTEGPGTEGPGIAGVYAGALEEAWSASIDQSRDLHTKLLDRPFRRVISCPLPIYTELWTAGKAAYKLEAVVADGGELVIYAPHLREVSATHGPEIMQVGYHPLPYFLRQWDRFAGRPLAVLAHSTHVKGAGTFDEATGTERPRMEVKLATAISPADCERLNLGYVRPGSLDLARAASDEGTLVVPGSGEVLFRLK